MGSSFQIDKYEKRENVGNAVVVLGLAAD